MKKQFIQTAGVVLHGQNVSGNDLWYHLDNGRWISARYVDNVGRVPDWCN